MSSREQADQKNAERGAALLPVSAMAELSGVTPVSSPEPVSTIVEAPIPAPARVSTMVEATEPVCTIVQAPDTAPRRSLLDKLRGRRS